MDSFETQHLVNSWILNELTILQRDYFHHLEKKEINSAATKLIKFVRERLSNEYLELSKASLWNVETKNTLLFVYQQLLLLLHPLTPFITEHIYQKITQGEKSLEAQIEVITEKEFANNNLWQIDCLLLSISKIRDFQKRNKVKDFYLELTLQWKKKWNPSFDFNHFSMPLIKSRIFILATKKKKNFTSFLNLQPFGVLWYQKPIEKEELMEQLKFYEKEYTRSEKLLKNINFIKKAPFSLIQKEKGKLNYYQKRKKDLLAKLRETKKNKINSI